MALAQVQGQPAEPTQAQTQAQAQSKVSGFRLLLRHLLVPRHPDRRCHLVSLLVAGEASSHPISLTRSAALFPEPHLRPACRRFWPKIHFTTQILKAQSREEAPALITLNSQAVSVDPRLTPVRPFFLSPERDTTTCRRQLPPREDDATRTAGRRAAVEGTAPARPIPDLLLSDSPVALRAAAALRFAGCVQRNLTSPSAPQGSLTLTPACDAPPGRQLTPCQLVPGECLLPS